MKPVWLERLVGRSGRARRGSARWVVIDVETAGLDPQRDALLSIGGVAVHDGQIVLGDSFEVVLRQPVPSRHDNILVHGLGADRQREGIEAAHALARFREWSAGAPCAAFQADFDRQAMAAASRAASAARESVRWLDIAALARTLDPGARARALDEWLTHCGVPAGMRHEAAGDALAAASLLLVLMRRVPPQDRDFDALAALSRQGRWTGA